MGKYVIKQGKTGPFFVLKAANGEPIGKSEVYSSEAAAKSGVESVKRTRQSRSWKTRRLKAGRA